MEIRYSIAPRVDEVQKLIEERTQITGLEISVLPNKAGGQSVVFSGFFPGTRVRRWLATVNSREMRNGRMVFTTAMHEDLDEALQLWNERRAAFISHCSALMQSQGLSPHDFTVEVVMGVRGAARGREGIIIRYEEDSWTVVYDLRELLDKNFNKYNSSIVAIAEIIISHLSRGPNYAPRDIPDQCMRCTNFVGSNFLNCAVNPNTPPDCPDFEEGSNCSKDVRDAEIPW